MDAIITAQVAIASRLSAEDTYEPLPDVDGWVDLPALEARARAVRAEEFTGECDYPE